MFSRWLSWNHRLRLTTLLTATVSVALSGVFLLVVLLVREQTLNRRFSDLENSVKGISQEWSSTDSSSEIAEDYPGLEIAVYDDRGRLLASTGRKAPGMVVGPSKAGDSLSFGVRRGTRVFVANASWVETEAGLNQLALVLAGLWLPLIALTAAVSWYGGGLMLRPVKELVASAEKLSGINEGETLTTTDRAEFASLARSLNQLIARVRQAASLQEQFASDAAHELRTPLSLLRTRIETNLKRDRTPEEHVLAQSAMLKQIERLTIIIEALLHSARPSQVDGKIVSFSDAVQKSIHDWAELREWPTSRLRLDIQSCMTQVSDEEIDVIVRNLLDNGARQAPDNSPLDVTVKREEGLVTLNVRDFGAGIREEDQERVFERFYRSDEGRARHDGGAGIGLAVVKRIVESHSGHIEFLPIDKGALVHLTLPAVE